MAREKPKLVIGWREWLAVPSLGIDRIKAKVDSGARSSALHAFDVRIHTDSRRRKMVHFKVHPIQRNSRITIEASAPLLEMRKVKSSSGHTTERPVVLAEVVLMGETWPIELTLTSRDEMGFRMLLGRQAMRNRFIIDPSRSYLADSRTRSSRSKKQK